MQRPLYLTWRTQTLTYEPQKHRSTIVRATRLRIIATLEVFLAP